jgi:hypothetical protein
MDWLNFFKYAGYAALVLGAIATVAVDIIKEKKDNKENVLKQLQMDSLSTNVVESRKLLEPFKDLATKLYPNLDQEDALEKLRNRIDTIDQQVLEGQRNVAELDSKLEIESNTIKSFDVKVSIEFSGKWNDPPYAIWFQPPSPMSFMKWRDNSKKLADLNFCASRINYKTINANTGLFENTLTILPGTAPLGELMQILNEYDEAEFSILLSHPEHLLDPVITFKAVKLTFFINGVKKGELDAQFNQSMDYSSSLKQLVPGQASYLNPSVSTTERPVDAFKFKL